MSQINGDRSRHNRLRKAKLRRRLVTRALRASLAAPEAAKLKDKADTSAGK